MLETARCIAASLPYAPGRQAIISPASSSLWRSSTPPIVRCAVIGCGRVTGNHLDAIEAHPQAELAAVCDLIPEAAQRLSERYGVPWYTNYHRMLEREEVDLVHIITPSGMHPTHAIDVIRHHRKHLIVEKPMALRLSDVARMREEAAVAGVKIFPVYQNRYNSAVAAVKGAIDRGELGRLAVGSVRLHWCRPQRYYDLSPWRGTWSMDGGALANQGIHYLDLLQHLVGEVESVYCIAATELVNVEVEDTGVAAVRFKSGAVGTIEITTTARPDDSEATISILGELGTAVIAGLSANKLATWTPDPQLCTRVSTEIPNAYGLGHKPLIADVIASLLEDKPQPISFESGCRAIALLNALYRSAEDGCAVAIADNLSSQKFGQFEQRLHAMYATSYEAEVSANAAASR